MCSRAHRERGGRRAHIGTAAETIGGWASGSSVVHASSALEWDQHALLYIDTRSSTHTHIYVFKTYIAVGMGSQDSKQLLRSGPTSRRALPSVIYYLVDA